MMMNWKFLKWSTSILFTVSILGACTRSEYTKLVLSELEKGTREDSILLGINFGDTRNEFYGKCFDLNRKQLVSQGPENSSVQYFFMDSLVHKEPTQIRLLFFPTFDQQDIIAEMTIELSYTSWAPWNKQYSSDSLKVKAESLFEKWYKGNEFVTANIKEEKLPVKVDSNRRIIILKKDTQSVTVKVQDLMHPKFKHSEN